MSDLRRSFAKAKLSSLPFNPPRPLNTPADVFDEEDEDVAAASAAEQDDALRPLPSPNAPAGGGGVSSEDESSSASSASSVSSAGTIIPSVRQRLFARGKAPQTSTSRFAPLPWTEFFVQELFLTPEHPARITHHVYLTPPGSKSAPVFVLHHGAGSSGLSFAVVSAELRKQIPDAGVLALDARGHGETSIGNLSAASTSGTSTTATTIKTTTALDLSLSALSGDVERVWAAACEHLQWPPDTPVILIGHSLGGAVMATVAKEARIAAKVLGFAVLDVVEGSAMDALQSMTAYLATRPRSFASVEEGVEWHLRSRTIRSARSAKASVPGLLRPETNTGPYKPTGMKARSMAPPRSSVAEEGKTPNGTRSMIGQTNITNTTAAGLTAAKSSGGNNNGGLDSDEDDDNDNDDDDGTATQRWTWRTDLAATQPFWEDWFVGLSAKFLAARGGKLLLLAGTDRLDKELMIGQMQGKYQLQVFPDAGHFLHEDAPERTAVVLADFWRRNDGSRLVLPPKVGDLLRQGKHV